MARGVFFLFLVGIGLGWVGVHYTTWGKVLPSTGLQVHVTFFLIIDEMAGGGMERGGVGWYRKDRKGGGVRTLFCWKIENRQKSATVGTGCFVFMRLVGSPTLLYLTLLYLIFVVGTGTGKVK